MPASAPFRFEELGSLQFERLCRELMRLEHGVAPGEWLGERLVLPDGIGGLTGPTIGVIAWTRAAGDAAVRAAVARTLAEWSRAEVPSVLLLTNLAAADLEPGVATEVVGAEQLAERIVASATLRLRVPSVLGICDVRELIEPEVAERSSGDLDAAARLARVFVPTRGYERALAVLERHRFAVLTGPPEMGKTAIARTLGLALATDGWELHECIRPDELWERFDRDRRQVFVADDAFGSTEYRPEAAERWAVELDRVLRALDDRHRLLWTSRPAPLRAGLRRVHREHGVERFPQPAEVQVDASALDAAEKALILFRHAKAAGLGSAATRLVREHGWRIVSHPYFTPERIRRFVASRLETLLDADPAELDELVSAEIREPTAAMTESFRALAPEHRAVLVALLDAPPGPVGERELAAAARRHSTGFAKQPHEVVDRLADHFLRLERGGVAWVHPSWRDLVVEELARGADARRTFLRACSTHGVALALSTAGGAEGERELPLLREDGDWDALGDRLAPLVPELDAPETARLLGALADARTAEGARAELDAVTAYALELLARRWAAAHETVPVGLLEDWFALAAELPEPPARPELARTWIELLPPQEVDPESPTEVARLDEWATLADLLSVRAPDTLGALDLHRHDGTIERFVDRTLTLAARHGEPPPHRDLLVRVLRRLLRVVPRAAREAPYAIALLLEAAPRPELPPVEHHDLSPELERLLEAPPPAAGSSDEAIVARVLGDL